MVVRLDLIIYKIKKLLNRDNYLSTEIEKRKKELNIKYEPRKYSDHLKRHWLIVLSISLFFLIIIICDIANITKFLGIIEFLKTTLTVPLLMVGIVLPVLILMINNIGERISHGFVQVYLDILRPFDVFKISMFLLAICVILFLSGMWNYNPTDLTNNILISNNAISLAVILVAIFIPLIGTFFLVMKITKYLFFSKENHLYENLTEYLAKKMMKNIYREVDINIFRKIINDMFKGKVKSISTKSMNHKTVNTDKKGKIIDFNKEILEDIINSIEGAEELYIKKIIGQEIPTYDGTIGHINGIEDQEKLLTIESSFKESFIIVENELENDNITIESDLEQLNELIINSINKNQENHFKGLIDVYFNLLKYYIESIEEQNLTRIFRYDDYPFSVTSLRLIEENLDDIIQCIVERNQNKFLEIFRRKIYELSAKTMNYNNFTIFLFIIRLFEDIYINSIKFRNEKGIEFAIDYYSYILYYLEKLLKNKPTNFDDLEMKDYIFERTMKYLEGFFKISIDNNDFNTSKHIEAIFDDIDMYQYYSNVWDEKHIIKEQMKKEENQDEYKKLKEMLLLLDNFEKLMDTIEKRKLIIWYTLWDYIIRGLDSEKIRDNQYYELASDILNNKLHIMDITDNVCFIKFFEIGEKILNSIRIKHGGLLSFCIGGLQLMGGCGDIPPSKLIYNQLDSIKKLCDKIVLSKKWDNLISGDISEKRTMFIDLCEKSAERYVEDRLLDISRKKISNKKIKEFKKEFKGYLDDYVLIEPILKQCGGIENKKVIMDVIHSHLHKLDNKIYFLDNNYKTNITYYVNKLISSNEFKEKVIIQSFLKDSIIKKILDKDDISKSINLHIEVMKNKGYMPNLIIIPSNLSNKLGKELISPCDLEQEYDFNFIGKFNNCFVVSTEIGNLKDEILVIDIKKGCRLIQIDNLSIDVRNVSDDDKAEILRKNPNINSKIWDYKVLIDIWEKYSFKILDKNAIRKLELLCVNSDSQDEVNDMDDLYGINFINPWGK